MINLILQSFGKESELRRAVITVLSFYACSSRPINKTRVLLFTDNPDFFSSYFQDLPVKYMLLTPQKIKEMRGNIDFLHRMKIVMIEEAFENTEGNILYADSDTFFTADPVSILNSLTPDKSYMHVPEYPFKDIEKLPMPSGATFKAFLELIEKKDFILANGNTLKINTELFSWNAGVMFFHRSHENFLPDVYTLTDQFYPSTQNHASEQYAFSIILQTRTHLQSCESVSYHYWYRIKKQIMDNLLERTLTNDWKKKTLTDKISAVRSLTSNLPAYFNKHSLTLKDNAVQAFNENKYSEGYLWTIKAIAANPLTGSKFIRDVLYHTKRRLSGK